MIKKFNDFSINEKQEIKKKDIQETIDEILDNLSSKGELSESEKEFMLKASENKIKNVTVPNMTGNFWSDMSNPHNIGTMYIDDDGVWKQLKSIEDEETDTENDDSDERYYRERMKDIKNAFKNNPGLKEDLEELLKLELIVYKKCKEIDKKYRKKSNETNDYKFNQKLDYATNGTLNSLINQFGDEDDDGNMFIYDI